MNIIDNAQINDNRLYDYTDHDFYVRSEFPIISDWLKPGSKVIDLGCGNGSLMRFILDRKHVDIRGIESTASGVTFCLSKGLRASKGYIDVHETYTKYANKEFDYAICNVTLQMVLYPEVLLYEMKRIAKYGIISFPNFAYFGNRFDLLCKGRMPRPMLHGYEWFNTGHIHQLSILDFENWCNVHNLKIVMGKHLGCFGSIADYCGANFFSKEAIYLVTEKI